MAESKEPGEDGETLRYLYAAYQEQYETILERIENALLEAQKLSAAMETVEGYKAVQGKDSFLPVGDGVFLKSKIQDSDKLIVYIGGGYLIEASLETSKEILSSRLEEINSYMKKLYAERDRLVGALDDIGGRIASLNG
ncbi:MAG: prefoldin subunit alpha [Candidatus Micrarchaeaceae archaeon]